ncbi:unnamed protein product [Leptidea sinapis]|uniref:Beta-ketoacyl synthase-like N-terminal domain-containing protein n=1 Tax=Leptidea sinapis TaxID=189913 RepID=A0A5E4QGS6_9NEOP|nr:unnamed protein product [Leptidea sinapis]
MHLLANAMDPMSRKIVEHTYEAIYDAGICPEQLSGKKVGVYIGTCMSESEKACFLLQLLKIILALQGAANPCLLIVFLTG